MQLSNIDTLYFLISSCIGLPSHPQKIATDGRKWLDINLYFLTCVAHWNMVVLLGCEK